MAARMAPSIRRLLEPMPCLAAASALAACAGERTDFRPAFLKDDQAVIYVYRPGEGLGAGGPVTVVVNQEPVALLRGGDHWVQVVPAGEHLVRVEGGSSAVARITLRPSESAYLRVRNAGLMTKTTIEDVPSETGQRQIAATAAARPAR